MMSDDSMTVWDLGGLKLSGVCERLLKPPPPPPKQPPLPPPKQPPPPPPKQSATTVRAESTKRSSNSVDILRDGSQTERSDSATVGEQSDRFYGVRTTVRTVGSTFSPVTETTDVTRVTRKIASDNKYNKGEQFSQDFDSFDRRKEEEEEEEVTNGFMISRGLMTLRTESVVTSCSAIHSGAVTELNVSGTTPSLQRPQGSDGVDVAVSRRSGARPLLPAAAKPTASTDRAAIDRSAPSREHSKGKYSCVQRVSGEDVMMNAARYTDDAECTDVFMTSPVSSGDSDEEIHRHIDTDQYKIRDVTSTRPDDLSGCLFQDWNDRLRIDETNGASPQSYAGRKTSEIDCNASSHVAQPKSNFSPKRSNAGESKKYANRNVKTPDSEAGHSYGCGGLDSNSSSMSPSEGTRSDHRVLLVPARSSRSYELLDDATDDSRYRRRRRRSSGGANRSKSSTRRSSVGSRVMRRALSIELTLTTVTTCEVLTSSTRGERQTLRGDGERSAEVGGGAGGDVTTSNDLSSNAESSEHSRVATHSTLSTSDMSNNHYRDIIQQHQQSPFQSSPPCTELTAPGDTPAEAVAGNEQGRHQLWNDFSTELSKMTELIGVDSDQLSLDRSARSDYSGNDGGRDEETIPLPLTQTPVEQTSRQPTTTRTTSGHVLSHTEHADSKPLLPTSLSNSENLAYGNEEMADAEAEIAGTSDGQVSDILSRLDQLNDSISRLGNVTDFSSNERKIMGNSSPGDRQVLGVSSSGDRQVIGVSSSGDRQVVGASSPDDRQVVSVSSSGDRQVVGVSSSDDRQVLGMSTSGNRQVVGVSSSTSGLYPDLISHQRQDFDSLQFDEVSNDTSSDTQLPEGSSLPCQTSTQNTNKKDDLASDVSSGGVEEENFGDGVTSSTSVPELTDFQRQVAADTNNGEHLVRASPPPPPPPTDSREEQRQEQNTTEEESLTERRGDIFAEKAFIESLVSSLGTIIFLLLAAIIFYFLNDFVEHDFSR